MSAESKTTFVSIKKALLYDVNGKSYEFTKAIASFIYFEDLDNIFVTATAYVVDSGVNFIGTLPIQGGEKLEITVADIIEEEYTYTLYVYKVYNRRFDNKQQHYNLALISREALYNEGVRISEVLSDHPDKLVGKILTEFLKKDDSKQFFSETCKYKVNFFPEGKKAHAIINYLCSKAVPQSSDPGTSESRSQGSSGTTAVSSLPSNTKKMTGTAGFLFFENRDGYHFKSIDYYFSDGSDSFGGEEPVQTYTYKPAIDIPDRFIIEEYGFANELDIIDQMRSGVFSTYMVFYNFSTGYYEEYTYNLADSFEGMAHLGSQSKLGKIQTSLSERPTRIISKILDHETWNSKEESGSPEERDGGKAATPFPDFQKYSIAQSFSRKYLMRNHVLEIVIPINLKLKIGDKIKVMLPNMSAQEFRKDEQFDEENSGNYLISKVGHNMNLLNSEGKTKLELIRDTYGMKEFTSNVK